MKISIAMATLNGARFISEQLESFTRQTLQPDEIVICDDGSTDGTQDLVRDFASTSSCHVRLFENAERLGVNDNFGKALSHCEGDVIFLSDQDDVWFENKIATVVEYFDLNPEIAVLTNDHRITDGRLEPTGETTLANVRRMGRRDSNFVHGCCTALRRDFGRVVLPIPSEASHDRWIGKVADSLQLRLVVDDVLQFYRQHESNTSRPSHRHVIIKTRRQEILHHGLKDASDGWLREASVTGQLSARLTDRASYLRDIGVSDSVVRKAVSEAETRRARLLERAGLVSRPRWQRLYGVPRFALSGGYRSFRGWASAIKDILR